ncbi:shikimate dehydrogenase [Hamadaea sp. NPDC051192]|uniref:shikimate dehydrogenase n=1 Tax=Hamadaea sp. NPDC051192 TaxID=3154940 RepID=UPI0034440AFB
MASFLGPRGSGGDLVSGGRYVVGLIGSGITGSLSPALHEREADELGLRYVYQILDLDVLGLGVQDTAMLVAEAKRLGFAGLNITHPCKQAIVSHLDELSEDAATLAAVNTVVFTGGRSIGYNTDWSGFAAGFSRNLGGAPRDDIVVLGAGGAGSAVAYALLRLGVCRLTVVDVDSGRAERLVEGLHPVMTDGQTIVTGSPQDLKARLADADGLVNATAVGMTPDPGTPLPPELLHPRLWVADVVYRPLETPLLAYARRIGCRTLDGGGMVTYQAAEALRLITGVTPDAERMYAHMRQLTSGGDSADHG